MSPWRCPLPLTRQVQPKLIEAVPRALGGGVSVDCPITRGMTTCKISTASPEVWPIPAASTTPIARSTPAPVRNSIVHGGVDGQKFVVDNHVQDLSEREPHIGQLGVGEETSSFGTRDVSGKIRAWERDGEIHTQARRERSREPRQQNDDNDRADRVVGAVAGADKAERRFMPGC